MNSGVFFSLVEKSERKFESNQKKPQVWGERQEERRKLFLS